MYSPSRSLSQESPPWSEHQSPHFLIRFPRDSPASKNMVMIGARLESVREAVLDVLDLDPQRDQPIPVVLSDTLDERALTAAGAEHEQIRAVYRSDAPGQGLDRAVVEWIVAAALRRSPTGLLVDGLLGHVTQRIDSLDPAKITDVLAMARQRGERISLAEMLNGPATHGKPLYFQVATAFVTFLIATYGAVSFRTFTQGFDPALPDAASEAVYGKPLAVLEQQWLASVKPSSTPIMGVVSFLRRSVTYLRPYLGQELLILLGQLIVLAFTIFNPISLSLIIDRAVPQHNMRLLAQIIGGLALLFVLQSLATLSSEYLNVRVGTNVIGDIRIKLFNHLQRLSMHFYSQVQGGDIMSRLSNDLFVVQYGMTGALMTGLYLILTMVVSAIILFFLEWRLALLTLVLLPFFFIGPRLFGKRAARASYERQQDAARVTSTLQENIGAQAVVKVFNLQAVMLATFRTQVAKLNQTTIRSTFIATLLGTTAELSVSFINLMILAVGAYMAITGYLTLGVLVAFTGLLGNVIAPLQGLSNILQTMQQATGGMQRIEELLDEQPQIVDARDAKPLPCFSREIRLEQVTFSYTGEQTNLNRINLTIPAGTSVAFVGPSGCGKSTILNLIMRFYDPASGAVLIDGHDLRHVTQESLHAQIGAVLQDTFLFNTSIRENIRLGRADISAQAVEAAAKAAEIHDLIVSMPEGYDTGVGERGARLSGGQRQRIAIARAILGDTPVVVLDEATSALDPETEAAINATLANLAKTRTMISVTHRLASVVHADQIFVLEGGQLVDQGTHEELVHREGLYRRLWEQQHGFVIGADSQYVGVEATRLQAIPFFRNLDGVLLAALANRFVTERYAEGETIFNEGEPGNKLYIVVRGQVEIVATGPTGDKRRLAILRDGDYFGEMALLQDAPRSATVQARTATLLLALDREQFTRLLGTIPDLRAAFDQVVAARKAANVAALG